MQIVHNRDLRCIMRNWNPFLSLFVMSITSVVALFLISKLLGKKQIAQLEFIDYIIGISIGSIAAEMATDINDKPIEYYLLAMFIFFVVDVIFSLLSRKSPFLKHLFKGRPQTVIYEGKISYKSLKKNNIDMNDLIGLCREKGFFDLNDIEYAILENNGTLSVLPKTEKSPAQKSDIDTKIEKASLPFYMVIDGRISYSSLNELQKDKEWLLAQLRISDEKELKNIIVAVYDDDKKQMNVSIKEKA